MEKTYMGKNFWQSIIKWNRANEALVSFYQLLAEEIIANKEVTEDEFALVEDEIENYICKQLYYL